MNCIPAPDVCVPIKPTEDAEHMHTNTDELHINIKLMYVVGSFVQFVIITMNLYIIMQMREFTKNNKI